MAVNQNINLKVFAFQGWDFSEAFTQMDIFEDIFMNTYSGTVDIMETEGVREIMPLIGEEIGYIQFTSLAPVSGKEHGDISFMFRVNKLEKLAESSTAQRTYRLHFNSLYHEMNLNTRVRKHYNGTAGSIVSRLVKAHYGLDMITLDATKHEQDFVFPNWNPNQCINFMSTVSISAQYNDPFYLFYQDRDGFHFTSLSKLMDKPAVKTIQTKLGNIDKNDDVADSLQMSTFVTDPLFDTLENYWTGMYGNTVIAYDKINKRMSETGRTYTDTHGDFVHVSPTKLTRLKTENPKNRFQFIMNNQPKNPGIYTHIDDWANKLLNRANQSRNNRVSVFTNGDTSIKVGDVVNWEFHSPRDGEPLDAILSGDYLITRIRHLIKPNMYSSNMEIVKDGLG